MLAVDYHHFATLMDADVRALMERQTLAEWDIDDIDVHVDFGTMGYVLDVTMAPHRTLTQHDSHVILK